MRHGQLVLGIAPAAALVVTGCAGKVRVASAKMCQAHGGCYEPVADICEMGND